MNTSVSGIAKCQGSRAVYTERRSAPLHVEREGENNALAETSAPSVQRWTETLLLSVFSQQIRLQSGVIPISTI